MGKEMSVSDTTTIDVPRGLDVLDADDLKLIESMRADDGPAEPEPENAPEPAPAPPAAQDAPEFDPDDDDGASPTGQRQAMVPHKNFHAVNERRKAAEAKLREEQEARAAERATLETRLNMLTQAIQSAPVAQAPAPAPVPAPVAPPAEEPIPDVDTDPVGHFRALSQREARERARLAEQVESLGALVRGSQEAQTQQARVMRLQQWAAAQESQFAAQEPSYRDAMAFLQQSRDAELEALGVADPRQRAAIIGQDVFAIASKAEQDGANFAHRLYTAAQKRGFAKAATAAPATPAVPALDADPAPAAPALRRQPDRDNTTSIGSLGSAPPARLSAEKLANMPEKEFEALIAKVQARGGDIRDILGY